MYGRELDQYIARSKVVLNLHFYEKASFEIFRVSHLLANHKCVVTEADDYGDVELEELASKTCARTHRSFIVELCQALVSNATFRAEMTARSHNFKKIDFVENVRLALEASK